MRKELTYLSLPDYFNKFLLTNYNEKIKEKDAINLQFQMGDVQSATAIKAIYILEYVFPRKSFSVKLVIKKRKSFYAQKKNVFLCINLTLTSVEFLDFYRFFLIFPLDFVGLTNSKLSLPIINQKLKMFDFDFDLRIVNKNLTNSFVNLKFYHLD